MVFIILGIIVSLLVAVYSFCVKSKENHDKNKPNGSTVFSFIMAILALIITFWGGCNSESGKETERIAKLAAEKKYDSITRYIIKLQNGELDSTISILKKQVGLLKEITGDNNSPSMNGSAYSQYNQDSCLISFSVSNKSKYPITGIRIHFHEFFLADKWVQVYPDFYLGDLAPNTEQNVNVHKVSELKWPAKQQYDFQYTITWTRGEINGEFSFVRNLKDNYTIKASITSPLKKAK